MVGIIHMSQWFPICIVHGLHWVGSHGDVLGVIGSPAALLSSLVKVTAGTHKAADHGSDDSHKEEDRRRYTCDSGGAELKEHASFLLPLCDHLKGIQTAVTTLAVPTTKRDEGTVKAIVPGAILIHVPQAVLICTHLGSGEKENGEHRQSHRDKRHLARYNTHYQS